MKMLHIADLHIGKRVNEFSMIEDQQYILDKIIQIAKKEKTDGVFIAGDIYDKTFPSSEAVELLDEFLTNLIQMGQKVFIISGNHDSAERLSFASRIMHKNGLIINGIFNGSLQREVLTDEFGEVHIYLMPFIKPAHVRPYYEEKADINSYEDAVRAVFSDMDIDKSARNILLAHQFVTYGTNKPVRSESEHLSIGGLDNVDASVYDAFDYVALGHLHGPQRIYRDTIRYAGSPLKYSFSEARQKKCATVLDIKNKGSINIRAVPLVPIREMRQIKGPIQELLKAGKADSAGSHDYIHAVITNEEEIYDAIGQLRQVYPNIMCLELENSKTYRPDTTVSAACGDVAQRSPVEIFAEFYKNQNNVTLTAEQTKIIEEIFGIAGGDES